ncbi:putative 4-hydroxybenzoate polyprenyltransferase [Flavobacteriales bacterium]|jgi:4-hydroxybenzoate polyprenyltransferase|nr:putative 4-hydroxybenzoate polyprenyltransferase [Flavobacteriales bacterium]
MATLNNYLTLIKFSHTVFALPFALIGFFLASSQFGFDWGNLVLILMCMVFARSAAMAFNRYIDRDIDLKNPRTAQVREIPKGVISPKAALLFVISTSLGFILTTYFINTLCFYLSPIALIVVLGYSYTKRFTSLCHLVLGLGLALAPLGAYLAVSGEFALSPILFSVAVLFWVSGFDIIYALQDDTFDKENKLNSIPVFLGRKKALNLSKFFHIITFLSLAYAGVLLEIHLLYWIGFALFSALLIYQHTIISEKDLSRVNLAFFTTNGIASVVFGVFVILDFLL